MMTLKSRRFLELCSVSFFSVAFAPSLSAENIETVVQIESRGSIRGERSIKQNMSFTREVVGEFSGLIKVPPMMFIGEPEGNIQPIDNPLRSDSSANKIADPVNWIATMPPVFDS